MVNKANNGKFNCFCVIVIISIVRVDDNFAFPFSLTKYFAIFVEVKGCFRFLCTPSKSDNGMLASVLMKHLAYTANREAQLDSLS